MGNNHILQKYMKNTVQATSTFYGDIRQMHILRGIVDALEIDHFAYSADDVDRMFYPYGRK